MLLYSINGAVVYFCISSADDVAPTKGRQSSPIEADPDDSHISCRAIPSLLNCMYDIVDGLISIAFFLSCSLGENK